jgi:hypothetical protein
MTLPADYLGDLYPDIPGLRTYNCLEKFKEKRPRGYVHSPLRKDDWERNCPITLEPLNACREIVHLPSANGKLFLSMEGARALLKITSVVIDQRYFCHLFSRVSRENTEKIKRLIPCIKQTPNQPIQGLKYDCPLSRKKNVNIALFSKTLIKYKNVTVYSFYETESHYMTICQYIENSEKEQLKVALIRYISKAWFINTKNSLRIRFFNKVIADAERTGDYKRARSIVQNIDLLPLIPAIPSIVLLFLVIKIITFIIKKIGPVVLGSCIYISNLFKSKEDYVPYLILKDRSRRGLIRYFRL